MTRDVTHFEKNIDKIKLAMANVLGKLIAFSLTTNEALVTNCLYPFFYYATNQV